MASRASLINKIEHSIGIWVSTIELNIKSGRTDILIDAEDICRNLLNMTFGHELRLLNQTTRNFPAIDMADEDRRIAVQVTASNTRARVQSTLTSFLEHGLNSRYDTLLVFILVTAPKFRLRVDFSVPDGMELKIMTFVDLLQELLVAETERLEKIAGYLEEVIGSDTPEKSAEAIPATTTAEAVSELSLAAQQVFHLAGLLPKAGLERSVFEYGLEPKQRKALPDLLERGVLYQQGSLLFLHPTVRDRAHPQSAANSSLFLDRLWNYEKSWHWDRVSLTREIVLKKGLAQVYMDAADRFPEQAVVYALRSAELYRDTQQYKRALLLEKKALYFLEIVHKDHWGAARAHHFAGECYTALQKHEHALDEWEMTRALCQKPLHASSLDLAEAYHNVGRALTALESYEGAEQNLLNALKLLEDFRKTCPDFAPQPWMTEIYDSLATVYTKRDLTGFAVLCSKNALRPPAEQEELWHLLSMPFEHTLDEAELQKITNLLSKEPLMALSGLGGMGKTELATAFSNAGYASADRGDYVQALEYLEKALAIQEQILPPVHPDIAVTYENMGYTYGDLGNYENAMEYHVKSLSIREKILTPEDPEIALSYSNIAWVHYDTGDYRRALEYMRRAVEIAERSLPEGHPDLVKYRTDLEDLERDIRQ